LVFSEFTFCLDTKSNKKVKASKSNLESYLIKRSTRQAVRLIGSTPGTLPLIDCVAFYVVDLMPLHRIFRFSKYLNRNIKHAVTRGSSQRHLLIFVDFPAEAAIR
jgi:hypothetical protein